MQLESQAKNFSFKLSESLIKNAARKETFTKEIVTYGCVERCVGDRI